MFNLVESLVTSVFKFVYRSIGGQCVCLNFPSFWSSWPTLTCEVLELPCFITSLFKIRELGISCVYLMNLFHCCPKLSVHMRVVLERSEFYDYDFFNWSERHEPKEKGFDQRNGLSRPKKISTAVITLLKVVITSDITGVFFPGLPSFRRSHFTKRLQPFTMY